MQRRPGWLSAYIPELDGLRGLAILSVVIYHCHPRLHSSGLETAAQWGWAGVNLFFVLSGFLITGIILDSRSDPSFFKNFYARRALRIWPVYVLLLALHYVALPWIFGSLWWAWHEVKGAPWLHYALFVQNMFLVALPPAIGPTWSLAIEEQYYVVWAPLARFVRERLLLVLLCAVLVASPLVRTANLPWITATHTLTHLDGIAVGSLIALSLRMFAWSRAVWRGVAITAIAVGIAAAVPLLMRGSAFTDSALAVTFGGCLLLAVVTRGAGEQTLYTRALQLSPLRFYGRISYGLYMTHIMTFVVIGAFDARMDQYGTRGDLVVVAVRLALSTAVATLLWYGFEQPILRLKKYFTAERAKSRRVVGEELVSAD